nr:hypothetical protein [Oscillospiraceae bacterium]
MSQTKKVTLSAMTVALGTAMMIVGAVIEVLDLSVCALASMLVVFIYLEIGSYYPWLVWICTSLATALLYPGSIIWAEYALVFGIYPLIKAYIERLPKWSWLIVKLLYINIVVWVIFLICEKLLEIPFFGEETLGMKIAVYVLMNIAFVAFDFFITVMVRFYYDKIRPRFKKFLKK